MLFRLDAIGQDAREARDGMLSLTAVIGEQRYGERIEHLGAELEKCIEKIDGRVTAVESALRQDMVAAFARQDTRREAAVREVYQVADKAKEERVKLEARIASLEGTRFRGEGQTNVVQGILTKIWPLLVAMMVGAAGMVGLKVTPPH